MVSYRTLCCMPCSDVHSSLMQVSELSVKKRAVQIRTSSKTDSGPTLFHNWANVSCYLGGGLSGK